MGKCLKCGAEFNPIRRHQRFDRPECRIAYNNDRKSNGIHLVPRVLHQLQKIADAQGIPIDEMCNVMLDKILKPDGRPLDEEEIYGQADRKQELLAQG